MMSVNVDDDSGVKQWDDDDENNEIDKTRQCMRLLRQ